MSRTVIFDGKERKMPGDFRLLSREDFEELCRGSEDTGYRWFLNEDKDADAIGKLAYHTAVILHEEYGLSGHDSKSYRGSRLPLGFYVRDGGPLTLRRITVNSETHEPVHSDIVGWGIGEIKPTAKKVMDTIYSVKRIGEETD